MRACKEQLLSVEFNPVRNANVAYKSARTCATDGLHHGFSRANNAFQHGISADARREILDPSHTFLPTFPYDIGRAELAREFLSRFMPAHGDDPLSAHLPG
jgi:hypothetical protein